MICFKYWRYIQALLILSTICKSFANYVEYNEWNRDKTPIQAFSTSSRRSDSDERQHEEPQLTRGQIRPPDDLDDGGDPVNEGVESVSKDIDKMNLNDDLLDELNHKLESAEAKSANMERKVYAKSDANGDDHEANHSLGNATSDDVPMNFAKSASMGGPMVSKPSDVKKKLSKKNYGKWEKDGGKKGSDWYKDRGHKKHGWKNVYHKEEWGDNKKYHDIWHDKDWKKKWKKWNSEKDKAGLAKWKDHHGRTKHTHDEHRKHYDKYGNKGFKKKNKRKSAKGGGLEKKLWNHKHGGGHQNQGKKTSHRSGYHDHDAYGYSSRNVPIYTYSFPKHSKFYENF
ncbi:hypothetical protein HDE_07321 [Halotydeus destructor]|nr:hypothetical protein HDE_07321 [Halotydeus destructor]